MEPMRWLREWHAAQLDAEHEIATGEDGDLIDQFGLASIYVEAQAATHSTFKTTFHMEGWPQKATSLIDGTATSGGSGLTALDKEPSKSYSWNDEWPRLE